MATTSAPNVELPNGLGNTRLQDWSTTALYLSLTLILWIPFGFNIACFNDGIYAFSSVEQGAIIDWKNSRPFVNMN